MDPLDLARALARRRANNRCEGCFVPHPALDPHHRQARGAGGVSGAAALVANDVRNILALCRVCHDRTEDADEWSECLALGWRVRRQDMVDPRLVPALIHTVQGRAWWLLEGDGYRFVAWDLDRRLTPDDLATSSWLPDVAQSATVS